MTNLFILNETFTNGFNHDLFNLISIASVICGLLVITSKNPIVSVLFLIGLFFNIVGYSMMLGINFIGLSYLLVYVGAVSILFLFLFMLINFIISEFLPYDNNAVPLANFISIIIECIQSSYYYLRFIEFLIRIRPLLPVIIFIVKLIINLYNGLLDFEFTCYMTDTNNSNNPDSTVKPFVWEPIPSDHPFNQLTDDGLKKEQNKISVRTNEISSDLDKLSLNKETDTSKFQSKVEKMVSLEKDRVTIIRILESRDGKNHYTGSSNAETVIRKLNYYYKLQNKKD